METNAAVYEAGKTLAYPVGAELHETWISIQDTFGFYWSFVLLWSSVDQVLMN